MKTTPLTILSAIALMGINFLHAEERSLPDAGEYLLICMSDGDASKTFPFTKKATINKTASGMSTICVHDVGSKAEEKSMEIIPAMNSFLFETLQRAGIVSATIYSGAITDTGGRGTYYTIEAGGRMGAQGRFTLQKEK